MFRQFKPFETTLNFEFKDPDTGLIQRADTLPNLYVNIIRYREQNGLEPIEHLNHVVENYLCGLPENCNKCTAKELKRSFSTYIKGGIALLKNMAFKTYVPQIVAEERAAQCVKCEYNIFPDKGPFMKWADEIAIMQVGDRKVSKALELGNCEVCTCSLRSKVFVGDKQPKPTEEELAKFKKVNCWQLKI